MGFILRSHSGFQGLGLRIFKVFKVSVPSGFGLRLPQALYIRPGSLRGRGVGGNDIQTLSRKNPKPQTPNAIP